MAKISVDTSDTGCKKKHCKHKLTQPHRHHIAHEWLFVSRWAILHKMMAEQRVRDFVCRYYEFRPEDVCRICAWHHAEIHIAYDRIIEKFLKEKKAFSVYSLSWDEAQELMERFRKYFAEWIKKESPGVHPLSRLGSLEID